MSVKSVCKLMVAKAPEILTFVGNPFEETTLIKQAEVYRVALGLPDTDRTRWAIQQSILHLLETTPDTCLLMETFRKLASNKAFLLEGAPVPEWHGEEVKTRISVLCAWPDVIKKQQAVGMYFRCLEGLVAGQLFKYKAPSRYIMMLYKSHMGLSRVGYALDPLDIAGMTFSVLLSKEDTYVKWGGVSVPPSCIEKNKELINERNTRKPCGRSAAFSCSRCSRTRKECRLAVR